MTFFADDLLVPIHDVADLLRVEGEVLQEEHRARDRVLAQSLSLGTHSSDSTHTHHTAHTHGAGEQLLWLTHCREGFWLHFTFVVVWEFYILFALFDFYLFFFFCYFPVCLFFLLTFVSFSLLLCMWYHRG